VHQVSHMIEGHDHHHNTAGNVYGGNSFHIMKVIPVARFSPLRRLYTVSTLD
jgi:hypothetical protein